MIEISKNYAILLNLECLILVLYWESYTNHSKQLGNRDVPLTIFTLQPTTYSIPTPLLVGVRTQWECVILVEDVQVLGENHVKAQRTNQRDC